MTHQDTISPTLFDLIAREWSTGADIGSMAFNANQTALALALDDGTLAIAEAADEDPPQTRIHMSAEDGRATIRPRSSAPKPLTVVDIGENGVLLGTIGDTDFLAGGGAAPLFRISPSGEKEQVAAKLNGPVDALDHCPRTGRVAFACGTRITIFDHDMTAPEFGLEHGEPISDIGFSPDGRSIAVTHDYGLTIWSLDSPHENAADIAFSGRPATVSWSPDSEWIATPLADGGLQLTRASDAATGALTGYPAPADSVAWNRKAGALATSGAFRVAAWSLDDPPLEDPSAGAVETGTAGLVPVSAVSSHPDRDLLVAGYMNGVIAIMQVGVRDELVLNGEDLGAVTDLVWSRDGKQIAAVTDRRRAAIITLPPQMFK